MNIIPGIYTTRLCNTLNLRRNYIAKNHNSQATKLRRKVLRGEKKKKSDERRRTVL